MMRRQNLIRPLVEKLVPYVPGEQPKVRGLIKLNTNENPYPPSPQVLRAIKAGVDFRLRLYPNPGCDGLRAKLAALHGCRPENILVGNGSDEVLAMAVRCFVEPASKEVAASRALVQYFTPSYSLYPVLAKTHGSFQNPVPLRRDFDLPGIAELRGGRRWQWNAALSLVTTPNAPSGRGYRRAQLQELCRAHNGVLVLDEAYVDFAGENALDLALRFPHVLVARTFSKAYSLCFQRVGYAIGHRDLISALHKIRDSYNVNGLGQIAAEATLEDLEYYRRNFRRIISTRAELSRELTNLGFEVLPSETNFILARPPTASARIWLQRLRRRRILVRWFDQPLVRQYLRITIGTRAEVGALVKAVKAELHRGS
jgi:histidinol-phosphate aminotransferase